ncbi:hypothetical protein NBRC110019_10150 [Neptunitalea chrysea]|uniref:Dienelactone hydrolase domain-containing protein n=1 Tax=Neptunitalea chrysea TaxID=1647581 RepID=A0A9W6B3I8_9FLAO|nr:hypothetical protein NBRC110019_10150 [Neptunitalea chrysea]
MFIAIIASLYNCNNANKQTKIEHLNIPLENFLKDTLSKHKEIDSIPIAEKYFEYNVEGSRLNGILFSTNDSLQKPGIIVLGEWWGINYQVKEKAKDLAKLGFVTVVPDLYDTKNGKSHPSDTKNLAMELYTNTNMLSQRFNVVLDSLKHFQFVDSTKIGVVGYSFGGSIALMMANLGTDLDAVAAFHSGLEIPIMPNKSLKSAILIFNGDNDSLVSAKSIKIYRSELNKIHATYKYVTYKQAEHGFTNKKSDSLGIQYDLPISYNKEADEKSWKELILFLNKYLH